MTTVARSWQWAATALTLAAALPVLCGDVLLAWHAGATLGLITSVLP